MHEASNIMPHSHCLYLPRAVTHPQCPKHSTHPKIYGFAIVAHLLVESGPEGFVYVALVGACGNLLKVRLELKNDDPGRRYPLPSNLYAGR